MKDEGWVFRGAIKKIGLAIVPVQYGLLPTFRERTYSESEYRRVAAMKVERLLKNWRFLFHPDEVRSLSFRRICRD